MIPSPILCALHNTDTMQPSMWGAVSSPVTGTIQAKASASAAAGPHNSMSNLLFVVVLFRAWVEVERREGKKKKSHLPEKRAILCFNHKNACCWEMLWQVKNTIKVLAKEAPPHILHYLRKASVKIIYSHDKKEFQTKPKYQTKPFFFFKIQLRN